MKLERSVLKIGLVKPVKLLHVTDSHLTLTDERDDERKRALSGRMGEGAVEYLSEQIKFAEENCDLLVHTGDLMDFISHPNAELARNILKNEKITRKSKICKS